MLGANLDGQFEQRIKGCEPHYLRRRPCDQVVDQSDAILGQFVIDCVPDLFRILVPGDLPGLRGKRDAFVKSLDQWFECLLRRARRTWDFLRPLDQRPQKAVPESVGLLSGIEIAQQLLLGYVSNDRDVGIGRPWRRGLAPARQASEVPPIPALAQHNGQYVSLHRSHPQYLAKLLFDDEEPLIVDSRVDGHVLVADDFSLVPDRLLLR